MKTFILTILILTCTLSYSQKTINVDSDATASYIAPNFITNNDKEFQVSTGAFFFDATKRMGIYNLIKNDDNSYIVKYLAEEQPDAIYEVIKNFLAKATVKVKDKLTVDGEVTNLIQKITNQLTDKSDSLNFLRTSLYRLNESAFNGNIDGKTYDELFKLIITTAAKINNNEVVSAQVQESNLRLK